MVTDYVAYRKHLDQRMVELGHELSGAMGGFVRLHHKAVEDGALSHRTKELMALSVAVALRCDGCIAYHVQDAIAAGASRQEIVESIGVAILMGGAPAAVYAAHVLDAVEQAEPPRDAAAVADGR
jgi:AhpD family alkylhydroperoxidase